MEIRAWVGAMMLLGGTACGPMPGYQMPHDEEAPMAPRAPPAPAPNAEDAPSVRLAPRAPAAAEDDEDYASEDPDERDDDARYSEDTSEPEDAPPPPPRPPRYKPAPNWEPEPPRDARREPAPEPPRREVAPLPAPEPSNGIRIVRLDAESYYLIDSLRKLCFLRHKESMTAIDCAKLPEANDTGRAQPPEPRPAVAPEPPARMPEPAKMPEPPARIPEPAKMPEPTRAPARTDDLDDLDDAADKTDDKEAPRPSSPSPDELMRFETAFIDIYCDRKNRDETSPEARIREHGLTTVRYEAIEAWWAGDENAWYSLTTKAAKSCK